MGRQLGAFDGSDELDRPDLNKCPDCGCFFASDECPLCGRVCPEEMRAGNRVTEKKKKKRSGGSSGRVQFIPWYYSWWFILIMMFVFPLVGIILFFTSPYPKKWKIIISAIAAVYMLVVWTGLGSLIVSRVLAGKDRDVNGALSRTQYEETCELVDADAFCRRIDRVGYWQMELVVVEYTDYASDPYAPADERAFICCDPDDESARVLLVDRQGADGISLRPGDRVTVWGQGTAKMPQYDHIPVLYAAYVRLNG